MKKVEQSWKVVLVLLLVATAVSIIKDRPASAQSLDVAAGLSYKVDPDWPKLRNLWPEWKDDHRWWIRPMANRLQHDRSGGGAEVAR